MYACIQGVIVCTSICLVMNRKSFPLTIFSVDFAHLSLAHVMFEVKLLHSFVLFAASGHHQMLWKVIIIIFIITCFAIL